MVRGELVKSLGAIESYDKTAQSSQESDVSDVLDRYRSTVLL